MSDKVKYPRADALAVAKEMVAALRPWCDQGRLIVAGSLRRRKQMVGDVEIVYVSLATEIPASAQPALFAELEAAPIRLRRADSAIARLEQAGVIERRHNVKGSEMWGEKNKLARHLASGIPVDLFATTEAAWFNYLVCRTGSAENNTAIASAALAKGWRWHPYGAGFTSPQGGIHRVRSEQEVFEFAGMPYKEPWER